MKQSIPLILASCKALTLQAAEGKYDSYECFQISCGDTSDDSDGRKVDGQCVALDRD